jgi:hypothetical protein
VHVWLGCTVRAQKASVTVACLRVGKTSEVKISLGVRGGLQYLGRKV